MELAIIITFCVFGVLFGSVALMFIFCAEGKTRIWGAVICIFLWLFTSTLLCLDGMAKRDAWNGGYCECGGHWELRGATKSRNGTTTKYYVCPDCYAEIEQ